MINYPDSLTYWKNIEDDRLHIAVMRFFQDSSELTKQDIAFLKDYIHHWINNSLFQSNADRDRIKSMVDNSDSVEDIQDLTETLLYSGIDHF